MPASHPTGGQMSHLAAMGGAAAEKGAPLDPSVLGKNLVQQGCAGPDDSLDLVVPSGLCLACVI